MTRFQRAQALSGLLAAALVAAGCGGRPAAAPSATTAADPLPSWKDGAARETIVRFVSDVTREGSPTYVPPPARVAVFDNDGTLWAEQPLYFQLAFAIDRVKALAPQHPEWRDRQPFKGVLGGDPASVLAGGEHALLELVMATPLPGAVSLTAVQENHAVTSPETSPSLTSSTEPPSPLPACSPWERRLCSASFPRSRPT